MKINIYTDGAAKGNPGPGGYGIVLMAGKHYKELSAGYRLTTNNRMELLAVIVGLEALKKNHQEVTVYSDSKYVVDAVEKGWVFNWEKRILRPKKPRFVETIFENISEFTKFISSGLKVMLVIHKTRNVIN